MVFKTHDLRSKKESVLIAAYDTNIVPTTPSHLHHNFLSFSFKFQCMCLGLIFLIKILVLKLKHIYNKVVGVLLNYLNDTE